MAVCSNGAALVGPKLKSYLPTTFQCSITIGRNIFSESCGIHSSHIYKNLKNIANNANFLRSRTLWRTVSFQRKWTVHKKDAWTLRSSVANNTVIIPPVILRAGWAYWLVCNIIRPANIVRRLALLHFLVRYARTSQLMIINAHLTISHNRRRRKRK